MLVGLGVFYFLGYLEQKGMIPYLGVGKNLLVMFGLLLDSMFLSGPQPQGLFVITLWVLIYWNGAPFCSLIPFCRLFSCFICLYVPIFFIFSMKVQFINIYIYIVAVTQRREEQKSTLITI